MEVASATAQNMKLVDCAHMRRSIKGQRRYNECLELDSWDNTVPACISGIDCEGFDSCSISESVHDFCSASFIKIVAQALAVYTSCINPSNNNIQMHKSYPCTPHVAMEMSVGMPAQSTVSSLW